MLASCRTTRARGGWTEEETKTLFEEVRIADSEGRSVKSVFDKISEITGRKPNSIRNYYYLKLKENGGEARSSFTPFGEEEIDDLLKNMLKGAAEGKSVRGIALELAGGDKKVMLRYQNKYRSLLKSDPELVKGAMNKLAEKGEPFIDPFQNARRQKCDISIVISELVDNLGKAGVDSSELLCSLNSLASAAAGSSEGRLSGELGKALAENSDIQRRYSRLMALNKGFLEMNGIERIAGLAEYIEALSLAIYEQ